MDGIIEDILIIESFLNHVNLLKVKENARMSIGYNFSALHIRLPPPPPAFDRPSFGRPISFVADAHHEMCVSYSRCSLPK
jgi:hypothetical protein